MNSAVIFSCSFLFLRRCFLLGFIHLFYLIQESDNFGGFFDYSFVRPGFVSSDYIKILFKLPGY